MSVAKIVPERTKVAEALDGVAQLYEDNLENYGQTSKSVGWKDEASQILRFQKLAQVIDPLIPGNGVSVNDLGCGYAAMFKFLDQKPGLNLKRYCGYDISDKMLAAARASINDSRARFINSAQLTTMVDYTFVSGTFNVKLDASHESWTEYVLRSLENVADYSKHGFAFNLLTTYVDWKEDRLYYGDPCFFFDFCKRHFSRAVSILHDYRLFEWTIVVKKTT